MPLMWKMTRAREMAFTQAFRFNLRGKFLMKVGTKLLTVVMICALVAQAQAVVTVQIASREAIDGTSLERLILQMDTDGDAIQGLDMIITAPVGTIHQEFFGSDSPVFQNDAVNNDSVLESLSMEPRFVAMDTFWLFNEGDLSVSNGTRVPPHAAFPQTGEGTTTELASNVDYLAGAFALVTAQELAGPQALVVNDNSPFTSRAVAQVVVEQGTQLTLALGTVADVQAAEQDIQGVGEVISEIPEPAGLMMGVGALGLLIGRRRRIA